MNYKYRITGGEYVLSSEEHNYCLSQMAAGNKIIVLRNGELVINMVHLKSANPCDDLTDDQKKLSQMSLGSPDGKWCGTCKVYHKETK